jgi:hypothetical protein
MYQLYNRPEVAAVPRESHPTNNKNMYQASILTALIFLYDLTEILYVKI